MSHDAVPTTDDQYKLVFERTPVPMWVVDLETLAIRAVNDAALAAYGYSRAEFLSLRASGLQALSHVDAFVAEMSRAAETTACARTARHRRKDGSEFDV